VSTTNTPRVGSELRLARKRAGLSREALARLADCSANWIAQLERDPEFDSPSLERIWRVLDALGANRHVEVNSN
jgi:transcriptional regulator with XRE-family HTH domain